MAENIKRHITHIKSKVIENGNPKLPTSSQVEFGEIAVNYAKDVETLSIKNESGTVITFSSDNYYTNKKLGELFSGNTTVSDVIIADEETIAAAYNDLNDRKLDASAYTPTDLSNYYTKNETSGKTEISSALSNIETSIEDLSGQTETIAAAFNYFNDIVGSGYTNTTITEAIENMDNAISAALNDLNTNKLDKTDKLVLIEQLIISSNTSSVCSITGSSNSEKGETIIYVNGGSSDVTVTVPTTYQTPDGAAIELTCPVGGYCEVSYLNIDGVIYARGL